ncbi:acyltransferase [Bacillus wiedmannii]|uniref:acyltransferase n=1 Tax=Bacillus wiedmannii TaxID=1890302 RepID=UPI00086E89B2|nr:acyltransferase [Bacillus wiedmannii]MDM5270239.1 acyltransferase [Bacillus wiedmannii]SCN41110.1 WfgM [Bacillus wiedmannii]
MRNRDRLKKYKKLIGIFTNVFLLLPKPLVRFILVYNRRNSSKLAMLLNYLCVKKLAKSCGDNVAIFSNVYLLNVENLELGNNISIHPMCYIDANGGIEIKDDVSIAHSTSILSSEHVYDDLAINIKDQGLKLKKTVIENNVWIGAGVRILSGVKIKSGSIVAAGAVVKKEVQNNLIVGGVPAKLLKVRR